MFGPLPPLYRMLVIATVLTVGIMSGIWIAQFATASAAAVAGALWGAIAGVLLGYVLLHDFHHRPRPVRVRRH